MKCINKMKIIILQSKAEWEKKRGIAFENRQPQLMMSPRGNRRIEALKTHQSGFLHCGLVKIKCQIIYVQNPLMTVKSVGSWIAGKK